MKYLPNYKSGRHFSTKKTVDEQTLNVFTNHINGAARTLICTNAAALAIVVIKAEPFTGAEFYNSVIRTNAVAVVTFKTIAAGHAATGFCGASA